MAAPTCPADAVAVDLALDEIAALRATLDVAVDDLLSSAEAGMALAHQDPLDRDAIRSAFEAVLSGCAFQDLAGQRLQRLGDLLAGAGPDGRPDAHLLNGPTTTGLGGGLGQADADALLQAQAGEAPASRSLVG